ncbi:MAG: hypothetical protein M3N23_09645, partial [Pseudomonadota bacterium]|nr:hypothetical protein [Pseudomonadota bacterium]
SWQGARADPAGAGSHVPFFDGVPVDPNEPVARGGLILSGKFGLKHDELPSGVSARTVVTSQGRSRLTQIVIAKSDLMMAVPNQRYGQYREAVTEIASIKSRRAGRIDSHQIPRPLGRRYRAGLLGRLRRKLAVPDRHVACLTQP